MGIVVISCVRPSVQPSMGLGLCIAYKALGRNGLQFGMLMYPDGLHSAFMDAYGYCCWSVCPSICPRQITWNKWHKIWHADVSPSLISLRSLKNQHILLVEHTQVCWIISIFKTAPSLCQAYLTHITVTTMQYLQILHCMAINNEFLNSQGQASKLTFM